MKFATENASRGWRQRRSEPHEAGTPMTPDTLLRFAQAARRRLRNGDGTFRRDYLRALTQRVDVIEGREIRITGSKSQLVQTLATSAGAETAAFGVPSFIPKWRAMVDEDENYVFAITL